MKDNRLFLAGSIKKLMITYHMMTEATGIDEMLLYLKKNANLPDDVMNPKAGTLCTVVTGETVIKDVYGRETDFVEVIFNESKFQGLVVKRLLGEQNDILWADREKSN